MKNLPEEEPQGAHGDHQGTDGQFFLPQQVQQAGFLEKHQLELLLQGLPNVVALPMPEPKPVVPPGQLLEAVPARWLPMMEMFEWNFFIR